MPNCFQLFRKGGSEPLSLCLVDREICAHFEQPVDEVKYLAGWFDIIGFKIAMGGTFKDIYEDDSWSTGIIAIAKWMETQYDTNAFVEIGKHRN